MKNNRKVLGLVFGLSLFAILLLAYYRPPSFRDVGIFGLSVLIVSYFTGLMALIISLLFTIFAFLAGLPLVSYVYGSLMLMLHRIHYMIFSFIVKKILRRNKRYREFEVKVKHSSMYRSMRRLLHRITRKAGLVHPHKLKVFEVKECLRCGKEIPLDSRACPYCIARQKRHS
ncbi:MAG: zinc ribbon domain-containing protein [Candidatus Altiarchaeota archaeon]